MVPVEGDRQMSEEQKTIPPGICFPWDEKVKQLPEIVGDKELLKQIWEENESLAYMYIWQCLLSF
jgi:hypothetical protein